MQTFHQSDADEMPDLGSDGAFEVRFRNLVAEVSEQDAAVEGLLAAQGLERGDLDRMDELPDDVCEQLDAAANDAADERIEDERRGKAPRLACDLSRHALRA